MDRECSKPTISVRNLNARCVEIQFTESSGEFRQHIVLFAFTDQDVTLIGEPMLELAGFLREPDCEPDEVVEFITESGALDLARRWRRCPEHMLSSIAQCGDFELNYVFLASIDKLSAARLLDLGRAVEIVEFGTFPLVFDELLHCAGDSDGCVMRWYNPAIPISRIVEHLRLICRRSSWDFVQE